MSIPWTVLIPADADEPITLEKARVICHTDPDTTEEDLYLMGLIITSRKIVEKHTKRTLAAQTWKSTRHYWPKGSYVSLPTVPVNSIVSATYTTIAGLQTMPSNQYVLVNYENRLPTLQLAHGVQWPTDELVYPGFSITYTCGYTIIPDELLEAMSSLIAYWYNNREAVITSIQGKIDAIELPLRYKDLIAPFILKIY